jgi:UDP-3-O-[3-hydroxymyristoyl] N-acetylglucosamine deacetylase
MDGSAGPFVFLIQSAGIATQPVPRRYLRVLDTVRVEVGDGWAELRPHRGFRIDYTLRYDHPESRRCKSAGFELSPTAFIREISRARAFGAGSGCGPRDPIVPGGNAVRLEERRGTALDGLRLGDEFVRHKVLDVVGDLYLLGVGLIGAFAGSGCGHDVNHLLLQRLVADDSSWEIVTFSDHAHLAAAFGRRSAPVIAETA